MSASTHKPHYALLTTLLKEARRKSQLTQTEVASKLGVPQAYISKVERGERRLDVVELVAYCEALNYPVEAWMKEFLRRRELSSTDAPATSGSDEREP
mgnify:CR=1 FL=1